MVATEVCTVFVQLQSFLQSIEGRSDLQRYVCICKEMETYREFVCTHLCVSLYL